MDEFSGVLVQLRKGALQYCVLACLRPGASYGRQLAQQLSEEHGLLESQGTLYPLLSRLRKQGWVSTAWQESASGPPRRYYELTELGHRALEAFEQDWTPFRDDVDAVLNATR
ncbi:PadR family transcriptional regulator [Nesterenkonia muleiensis]|uniref:PadR family transcriptional regulator n=1 Tax=Nesterenkonia muleiensis TaxID=2282648 RepID=UPI000E728081|nr:PadR family transcriptional regulator [Nesterenkonia muleiensis]